MPYTVTSSNLPSNVKKASPKQRRQWVHVFNGEYDKHNDEGRAFATANAVLGRARGKKEYDGGSYGGEYGDEVPVSQAEADYDASGGKSSVRCDLCEWWKDSGACVLVEGDIAPEGVCRFFATDDDNSGDNGAKSLMDTKSEGNALGAVVGRVKSLLGIDKPRVGDVSSRRDMFFVRTKDGRTRFVATVSNNFRDRDREVIPENVHREYIEWADHEQKYPELWLWHAGAKSRWGEVDLIDMSDGFVVMSGLVDQDKEYIAEGLAAWGDVRVSHGFLCTKDDDGIFTKYRTFEISPLPASAAANEWTGFRVSGETGTELDMGFTKTKRDRFLQVMPEAEVVELEKGLGDLASHLKARGIDWKDFEPNGTGTATTTGTKQDGGVESTVLDLVSAGGAGVGTNGVKAAIHHPHDASVAHTHYHVDGTFHEHVHSHGDGSVGHDTDAHMKGAKEWVGHEVHLETLEKEAAAAALKIVTNANKTKPSQYKDVPDDKFLDKENWKYPADEAHIKAALSYFNHEGQKDAGGYDDAKWSAMGRKLAGLLGEGYSYKGGKVVSDDKSVDVKARAATDAEDAADDSADEDAEDANGKKKAPKKKELDDVRAELKEIKDTLATLTTALAAKAKSQDDITAEFFKARVADMPRGYQASETAANRTTKEQDKSAEEFAKGNPNVGFLQDVLMGGIREVAGGGGN